MIIYCKKLKNQSGDRLHFVKNGAILPLYMENFDYDRY